MVIDEVTATVLGGCGLLLGGSLLIWFSIVGVEKTVRPDRPRVRPGAGVEQPSAPRPGVVAERLTGARAATPADRVTADGGPADRARGGYGVAAILRRCDGGSDRVSRDSSRTAARHAADRAVPSASLARAGAPTPRGRAVDVSRVVRSR
ncbi:hypothetical protein FHR81_005046 [Actinoalloteichus hoggarensis]|uniref:Uncharacterized protein n=1 Tax=Actinoalloteichus hoggarensis TaxID=1470176 RepID=A0A221WBM9_9PSEU|nr:hypothetical protein [Actinoalloteichus hoggarensis]ASO22889.1 hypothetical protein AHOG_26420 [Actinoalloteichus hoggarensis]MBB5923969.1 hypothetical protein [Actinoalloteichus hoggarensis]